jgi:hypothetical protein
MNCKDPKCVYSKRYSKCILPNAYIETIAECGRNKIKRKDCKYHEIKEELKANACKKYRVRTGQPSPKSSSYTSSSSSSSSPPKPVPKPKSSPLKPKSLSQSAKDKLERIRKNILARKITNKFKVFITPFINRISARIESRIEYYDQLFKVLSQISEQQCLNFFNETNGKKQYTLGDNMEILLSKQIGTDSKYGVVYLSNLNIQYKRLYKFAVKIMKNSIGNIKETKLTQDVSNLTLRNINPHFPILYKKFVCNTPPDSYQYPKLIFKSKYIMLLSELANGDLKTVVYDPAFHTNLEVVKNAIQQIYIAILSFHIHTNQIHKDAHWGNFLYHKIKPGGYIHYKIYGVDVYLKNLGYLWIIWDYGMATKQTYENSYRDYDRVIYAFVNNTPRSRYGWIETKDFVYSNDVVTLVESVFDSIRLLDQEKYLWIDKLLKSRLFSKELVKPPNSEILNFGNPYVLNK